MSQAVFVDAKVPIYAAGRAHACKQPCARVLRLAAEAPQVFVTTSEVLQELVHFYLARGRWALGREVVHSFDEVLSGQVESVHAEDIIAAANLADHHQGISARDLVHAAVMQRLGLSRIVSTDADFDRIEGIERLDPVRIDEWEGSLLPGPSG